MSRTPIGPNGFPFKWEAFAHEFADALRRSEPKPALATWIKLSRQRRFGFKLSTPVSTAANARRMSNKPWMRKRVAELLKQPRVRAHESVQAIYLIRSENGLIKIGIAREPEERLRGLRTGCPVKLELIFAAYSNFGGAPRLENKVHRALRDRRRNGEWFDVTAEDAVRTINAVASDLNLPLIVCDMASGDPLSD